MQEKKMDFEFHERVRNVLNAKFDLKLTGPGQSKFEGTKMQWDLGDRENRVFVEIMEVRNATERSDAMRRLEVLIGFLLRDFDVFPINLFAVFTTALSQDDLQELNGFMNVDKRVRVQIVDVHILENYEREGSPKVEELKVEPRIEIKPKRKDSPRQEKVDNDVEKTTKETAFSFEEGMFEHKFRRFSGKFWWLNADQQNWPIEMAVPGEDYSYPKRIKGRMRRGFKSIAVGDIAITYQKSPESRLAGIYQVSFIGEEEVFFRFVYELPTKITWSQLNKLDFFKNSVVAEVKTGSLFSINNVFFIELLRLTTRFMDVALAIEKIGLDFEPGRDWTNYAEHLIDESRKTVLTQEKSADFDYVRSEAIATDHGTVDSLDFERDAQALAALIALEKMEPPLAIALFGQWGSGKSFFMQCIEDNIRILSDKQAFPRKEKSKVKYPVKPKEKLFLQGIAHIKFNAWSYLDANLWAGLAHSLFEKLNEYITENSKGERERLRVQLKISQRLKILHSDLNDFKEKKDHLSDLKQQIEDEKEREILRFFDGGYDKAALSFLEDIGLTEEDAKKLVPSKLKSYVSRAGDFVDYLKRNSWRLGFYTLVGAAVGAGGWQLWKAFDQEAIAWGTGVLATVAPFASKAWNFAKAKAKTVETIQGYIDQIEQPKSEEELDQELKDVRDRLKEIDSLIEEVEKSIAEERSNTANISQLAIANFISARPEHEEYKRHLGIITTIRKDFETLSELFYEAPNLDAEKGFAHISKDQEVISSGFEKEKKLDRIVLYIDDLDRCSDEKVLEVLQAVHLLMAFPLFIVLVGVDERCVHNALTYRQLKRYKGIDRDLVKEKIFEIEPREYLEKIFQIPFQLPIATPDNIENLIESIVPDTEEEPVKSVDDTGGAKEEKAPYVAETKRAMESRVGFDGSTDPGSDEVENNAEVEPAEAKAAMESKKEVKPTEADRETNYVQPEKIGITDFEKGYLKKLSVLVGRNPRTVKRYVNIARIVKTHESEAFKSDQDTVNTLFLIAFVLGEHREVAIEVLKSGNSSPIWTLIGRNHQQLETLLKDLYANDELIRNALTTSPANFTDALRFVERFSYRTALKEKVS